MKIACVDIQNFRKLKSCRIELNEKETIFVGANNSGKTSAMDALILFLKKSRRKEISTTDFTITNWQLINDIGKKWIEGEADFFLEDWTLLVPSLDIWLSVEDTELQYVLDIIPVLNWHGGYLGVRLCFEPEDIEKLYKDYKQEYSYAQETVMQAAQKAGAELSLWPKNLKDFLDKKLHSYFKMKTYLLDPEEFSLLGEGRKKAQKLPDNSIPLDVEPFEGLFKIDIINAQRGFSDAVSDETGKGSRVGSLTTQLKSYYSKHLDPSEQPEVQDIEALLAIDAACRNFDEKLDISFKPSIDELRTLGYPGFTDPQIQIMSKINPIDCLNHSSAVKFNVLNDNDRISNDISYLPEKYNGLGYQNLISMVFKLMQFRDEWMRVGKVCKDRVLSETVIEPLHLVLIEEPEAHLHAQVQQVFIKKAYEVLRNHENLKESSDLTTQILVSTHSSHIAYELDFKVLRYFRKSTSECGYNLPCAEVVNLSSVFGEEAGQINSKQYLWSLKHNLCYNSL